MLRLRRLRREIPTAEEATKNPRPGGQTRVGISAGTMRNPARLCWEALRHRIPLGGSPNGNLQGRPGRLKEEINLPARDNFGLSCQPSSTSGRTLHFGQAIRAGGQSTFASQRARSLGTHVLKCFCSPEPFPSLGQCLKHPALQPPGTRA